MRSLENRGRWPLTRRVQHDFPWRRTRSERDPFPGKPTWFRSRLAHCATRAVRNHFVGTLEFTTRDGETFVLRPGEVLLAADTTGTGHRW